MEITPREIILKRLRQSLMDKSPNPNPALDLDSNVYSYPEEDLLVNFANMFTRAGGELVYCSNRYDFIDHFLTLTEQKNWTHLFCAEQELTRLLEDTGIEYNNKFDRNVYNDAVISSCEAIIARSGTLLVSSKKNNRQALVTAHVHVFLAYASQLVRDIKDSFLLMRNKYGRDLPEWMQFITGPSRTADIEKQLVTGVHGAKEIYIFLVDDRESF